MSPPQSYPWLEPLVSCLPAPNPRRPCLLNISVPLLLLFAPSPPDPFPQLSHLRIRPNVATILKSFLVFSLLQTGPVSHLCLALPGYLSPDDVSPFHTAQVTWFLMHLHHPPCWRQVDLDVHSGSNLLEARHLGNHLPSSLIFTNGHHHVARLSRDCVFGPSLSPDEGHTVPSLPLSSPLSA